MSTSSPTSAEQLLAELERAIYKRSLVVSADDVLWAPAHGAVCDARAAVLARMSASNTQSAVSDAEMKRLERYSRAMAYADDEDMYEWYQEYGRRARAAVALADEEIAAALEAAALVRVGQGEGLEPPGCPLPGACACPGGEAELATRLGAAIRRATAAEAERDRLAGELERARMDALEEAAKVAETETGIRPAGNWDYGPNIGPRIAKTIRALQTPANGGWHGK